MKENKEDWKNDLMNEFCVMFERSQDDTVVERLEKFISKTIEKEKEKSYLRGFKEAKAWDNKMVLKARESARQEYKEELISEIEKITKLGGIFRTEYLKIPDDIIKLIKEK